MKILNLDFYRDGGTAVITTDEGTFLIDGRLDTKTFKSLYKEDFNNIITQDVLSVKTSLKKALKKYQNTFYNPDKVIYVYNLLL